MKQFIKYKFTSILILALLTISVSGCKSAKAIASTGEASSKLTSKQLIKAHKKNNVDFKTLQARAKIDITQGEKTQGATFNLRMQKDEVIWLSAPLGLARMKITPDQVQFYNKTDNTYFDGNYQLLSDFVGFELDFQKVQNILMGQAIYDLKAQPHDVNIQDNSYVLQPQKQDVLLELFYLMNASHFKLNSLQMAQSVKRRFLQVDYKSYQDIEKNVIPKEIKIIAVEDTDEALIDMEIKSVTLNGEVRFPFRIPSGYKEIELK
jgi:outer membrane biogenesis lipoprotein LolB